MSPADERAPVSITALGEMLDADIARSGAMESFMIRSGLLREILDELARHRLAASSPAVDRDHVVVVRNADYLVPEDAKTIWSAMLSAIPFKETGNG